jgi:hypothetical protein
LQSPRIVRFTPISDQTTALHQVTLRANNCLVRCSKFGEDATGNSALSDSMQGLLSEQLHPRERYLLPAPPNRAHTV